MSKTAVIISTGDELTTGRVVDTNSTVVADRLTANGCRVAAVLKVGDDLTQLLWALERSRELGDLIVGTGGLGPTADDLTTAAVADFLGVGLRRDESVADDLNRHFLSRGLPWTVNNLKQATFPEGSTIIPNPKGTAPGFCIDVAPGKPLFWLSGVPQEMAAMLDASVIPCIRQMHGSSTEVSACTFKIYGTTEAKLDELLKPVALGRGASLSFRAHYPDLSVRLTVRGDIDLFARLRSQISDLLGGYIYAEGDVTLEDVVGRLLIERRKSLALAESCTGGLISHRITRIAGSSAYFLGAAVTYSNIAKHLYLGVSPSTLQRCGAVSRETALEMSRAVRVRTGSDVGLSVTGIAGPSGGSPDKPVGTVWISICQTGSHEAQLLRFHGDRERIIRATSQAALNGLRLALQKP